MTSLQKLSSCGNRGLIRDLKFSLKKTLVVKVFNIPESLFKYSNGEKSNFQYFNIPSDEIRFLQHKLISKNSINLISCYMFVCQHFTAGIRISLNIHTIFE